MRAATRHHTHEREFLGERSQAWLVIPTPQHALRSGSFAPTNASIAHDLHAQPLADPASTCASRTKSPHKDIHPPRARSVQTSDSLVAPRNPTPSPLAILEILAILAALREPSRDAQGAQNYGKREARNTTAHASAPRDPHSLSLGDLGNLGDLGGPPGADQRRPKRRRRREAAATPKVECSSACRGPVNPDLPAGSAGSGEDFAFGIDLGDALERDCVAGEAVVAVVEFGEASHAVVGVVHGDF